VPALRRLARTKRFNELEHFGKLSVKQSNSGSNDTSRHHPLDAVALNSNRR